MNLSATFGFLAAMYCAFTHISKMVRQAQKAAFGKSGLNQGHRSFGCLHRLTGEVVDDPVLGLHFAAGLGVFLNLPVEFDGQLLGHSDSCSPFPFYPSPGPFTFLGQGGPWPPWSAHCREVGAESYD